MAADGVTPPNTGDESSPQSSQGAASGGPEALSMNENTPIPIPVPMAPTPTPPPSAITDPSPAEVPPQEAEPVVPIARRDSDPSAAPPVLLEDEPTDALLRRYTVPVEISMPPLGSFHGALTPELNPGGVWIHCWMPQHVGSRVAIWVINPKTGAQVPVRCQVTEQVRDDTGKLTGLIMRFTEMKDDLRTSLQRIIAQGTSEQAPSDDSPRKEVPKEAAAQNTGTGAKGPSVGQDSKESLGDTEAGGQVQQPAPASAAPMAHDWIERVRVFERSGRYKEAVGLLREALDREPMRTDLHLRVAQGALKTDQLKLATWHLDFVKTLGESSQQVAALQQQVNARRAELLNQRRQEASTHKTPSRSTRGSNRTLWGILSTVVFLVLTAYNVWTYVIPHPGPIQVLNLDFVADLLPATKVSVYEDRLYVVTTDAWHTMKKDQKEKLLRTLADRAKSEHSIREVIVSKPGPTLLGSVRTGKIRVYR